MALEIKQSLRLAQQLVITPQLQQAIKLLQLSRLELQNLVQHELLENPVLEEGEEQAEASEEEVSVTEPKALTHEVHDKEQKSEEIGTKDGELKEPMNFDWENYLGTYNSYEALPSGNHSAAAGSDETPIYENKANTLTTLQDHLLWQLQMADFTEEELLIAEDIVATINTEGYFTGNLAEIATNNHCSEKLAEAILEEIQQFDPTGVGARTLQECLKLQIKPFSKDHQLLERLIDNHLADLEKRNFQGIAKSLGLSLQRLQEVAHLLSVLEPKPGRPFGGESPQYIIPDVFVQKLGEEYIIILNDDGLPKLQVSSFYRNAFFKKEMSDQAKEYIQEKMRSAMWLIRSIHQRQRTLYRVTQSIVKFQKNFLEHGISHLKPLVLRDVAQDIQMHESTVSRVTTNKFVQTPRGLYELKFFFNTKVPTGTGEGITSEAVRASIQQLIDKENTQTPLSDQEIAKLLKDRNINISRRTVAKYREMLGISPSSRRRQIL